MAEQLDGEVSSGSLSCHSQSATPFCRTREERKEEERDERRVEEGGRRTLRYTPELPSLGPPLLRSSGPQSRATDFQFFFELLHAANSRSNSLSRSLPHLRLSSAPFLLHLLTYSFPLSFELLSVSGPRE